MLREPTCLRCEIVTSHRTLRQCHHVHRFRLRFQSSAICRGVLPAFMPAPKNRLYSVTVFGLTIRGPEPNPFSIRNMNALQSQRSVPATTLSIFLNSLRNSLKSSTGLITFSPSLRAGTRTGPTRATDPGIRAAGGNVRLRRRIRGGCPVRLTGSAFSWSGHPSVSNRAAFAPAFALEMISVTFSVLKSAIGSVAPMDAAVR